MIRPLLPLVLGLVACGANMVDLPETKGTIDGPLTLVAQSQVVSVAVDGVSSTVGTTTTATTSVSSPITRPSFQRWCLRAP
jgi:hypothetical protein